MLSPTKRSTYINTDNINYKFIESNGTASITESPEAEGDIFIPATLEIKGRSYTLNKVTDSSFEKAKINSLTFAKNSEIMEIGSNCFGLAAASTVKKLVLPPKIRTLCEDWCFMTPNLTDVSLDNNNKNYKIENGIIYNENKTVIQFVSRNVEELVVLKSVKKIAASACQYAKIENLTFEENSQLEVIERSAFFGCNIKSIIIPKSVKTIGDFAFHTNRNLENVRFEEGTKIENIGVCSFLSCDLKNEVNCPSEKISHIGNEAFGENKELKQVLFYNSYKLEINRDAFKSLHKDFAIVVAEDTELTGSGIPEKVIRRKRGGSISDNGNEDNTINIINEIQTRDITLDDNDNKNDGEEKENEGEMLRRLLREKDEENARLRAKIERMKKMIANLQEEVNS